MIVRKIAPKLVQKRVAAYARVSTLMEAQEESYETQVAYYEQLIMGTEGWELAGIYADRGITGTSAQKRPGFLKMIEDAKAGKVDIILCKSISRFSRNFAETEKYVHELKSINVECRFEKEGISSFNPSSDMIFSAMAALSQEESRSISENLKWTFRRLKDRGIRHVGSNHMLGYDEVEGVLIPNKDAWIVKLIFEEFAAGLAPADILRHLNEKGARRMRSTKPFNWSVALQILKNEAYVGDRLLQKAPPRNYLTKKPDPNEAYDSKYIYNDHEGIITPVVWDAVRERLRNQQELREKGLHPQRAAHFLYGKVFCAECGGPYIRCTVRHKKGPYKIWRCRRRVHAADCKGRHIGETELLHEISNKLGWTWENVETFDVRSFMESVDRVLISDTGIEVIKASNAEKDKCGMESA